MTDRHYAFAGTHLHTTGPRRRVRGVVTTNGDLDTAFAAGQTTPDSLFLADGDELLLAGQTNAAENGLYVVNATGAPTRAADFDDALDMLRGLAIYIEEGAYAEQTWLHITEGDIEVDTTELVFIVATQPHIDGPDSHEASTIHYAAHGHDHVDQALDDLNAHIPEDLVPADAPVFTGVLDVSEALALSGALAQTITGDVDDLQPTNFDRRTVWRVTATVDANVTGLFVPTGVAGRVLIFENAGTTVITLKEDDGGSVAGNRFLNGGDVALPGATAALLRYDTNVDRWRLVSSGVGNDTPFEPGVLATLRILGLPDAHVALRLAGSIATGVPTSGDFQTGDLVFREDTSDFASCVVGGSPGAWQAPTNATLPPTPTVSARLLVDVTASAVDSAGVTPVVDSSPTWNDGYGTPPSLETPVAGRYRVTATALVAASSGTLSAPGRLTWQERLWLVPAGLGTTPVQLLANSKGTGMHGLADSVALATPMTFDNGTSETVDVTVTYFMESLPL